MKIIQSADRFSVILKVHWKEACLPFPFALCYNHFNVTSVIPLIKDTVTDYPEISGAYDLVLHNYGPDSYTGSVHIEVPDTLSADDLDKLIRIIRSRLQWTLISMKSK